jgi:hypothetical protein
VTDAIFDFKIRRRKMKWLPVCMILLLVSLVMVGCGVAQSEYDAVLAEREAATTLLAATTNELDTVKSQLQSVQDELSELQTKHSSTVEELESAQTSVKELRSSNTALKDELAKLLFSSTEPTGSNGHTELTDGKKNVPSIERFELDGNFIVFRIIFPDGNESAETIPFQEETAPGD